MKRLGRRGWVLLFVLSLCIGFVGAMYLMTTDIMPIFRGFYEDANAADYTYDTYGYNASVIPGVQDLDGVEEVQPRLIFQVPLHLQDDPQTYQLLLVGVNVTPAFGADAGAGAGAGADANLPIYSYSIERGENLAPAGSNASGTPPGILLTKEFAVANSLDPTDQIRVDGLGNATLEVRGTVFSIEFVMVNTVPEVMFPVKGTMGVAYVDAGILHDLVRQATPGFFYPHHEYAFNQLQVTFEPGTDPAIVNQRVEDYLAQQGVERIASTSFEESYTWKMFKADLEGSVQFMYVLMILSLIMAFTSSLSIFMSFARNQRAQVGTLGSLGYTKGEVTRSFVVLALEITAITTTISTFLAYGLLQGMMMEIGGAILGITVLFPFTWEMVVIPLVAGSSIALLAMIPPLRKMLRRDMADLIYNKEALTTRVSRRREVSTRKPSTKLVWRNLLRHPKKTGLNLVGVAFSLLIVGGSLFMWASLDYTTGEKFTSVEEWDATVSFSSPVGIDTPEVTRIRDHPAVATVEGGLRWQVLLENRNEAVDNETSFVLGIPEDAGFHEYDLSAGRVFSAPDEVVVSTLTRNALALDLEENLTVHLPTGTVKNFTIVGFTAEIVDMVYISLSGFQDFTGTPGQVNILYLCYAENMTDSGAVLQEIYATSPQITVIQEMADILESIRVYVDLLIPFLGIIIGFAAVVEFFVLYNATLMSIGDHETEYGVLRSLGFPKRRLFLQILSENVTPIVISLALSLVLLQPTGMWLLSLYAEQFAFFPDFPWWMYVGTIGVPVLIMLWSARSGMKYIYRKTLYEQVQTQFVA